MQAFASNFELIYGEDVEEKIVWKILSEKEQITVCPMEDAMADGQASQDGVPSDQSPFFDDIPWHKNPTNVDYNSVLFEKFYPSLKGKAAVLDEYLLHTSTNPDQPNTWKLRVKDGNIKFHHPDSHDLDDLVKSCMTLMITSVLEEHKGIAGLWQRGNSSGMKEYPNFGQFIPKDYFKAFIYGFPYLWTDKKYWDVNSSNFLLISLLPSLRSTTA